MAPVPNQPPPQHPQPPRPNTPEPGPLEKARAPTGPAPQPQNQGTCSSHFNQLSHPFGQAIQRGQPACTAQAAKPIPSPARKHSAGEKEEAGGGDAVADSVNPVIRRPVPWGDGRRQIASSCDPPPLACNRSHACTISMYICPTQRAETRWYKTLFHIDSKRTNYIPQHFPRQGKQEQQSPRRPNLIRVCTSCGVV